MSSLRCILFLSAKTAEGLQKKKRLKQMPIAQGFRVYSAEIVDKYTETRGENQNRSTANEILATVGGP
jgi:hypothetical protein